MRTTIEHRNQAYHLQVLDEIYDAFIGGNYEHGTEGKTQVQLAVEHCDKISVLVAVKVLKGVNHQQVQQITESPIHSGTVRRDSNRSLNIMRVRCEHQAKVIPRKICTKIDGGESRD